MNPILRNFLAVLAGIVVGGIVNMAIIMISGSVVPLPAGVDPNDIESMNANMHLYKTKHFIMPILAHALGTLIGAFTAAKIAVSRHITCGIVVGGFFMIGGIMAVSMLPNSPTWMKVTDLALCYFPMGYLGAKLGMPKSSVGA